VQEPAPAAAYACPCGAAAPSDLPDPGRSPVACARCGTPLVRPGAVGGAALVRGAVAGIAVAVVCAFAWSEAARWTSRGAAWFIVLAAVATAMAVRGAARARSPGLQWVAVGVLVVFLGAGEPLLFRRALEPRLVAMHAAEHDPDPELPARQEAGKMTFGDYLSIEVTLGWFLAVGAGAWVAWRILRPQPAVAAHVARAPHDPAPAPEPLPNPV